MSGSIRSAAHAQAERMLVEVAEAIPGALDDLRRDPLAALRAWDAVEVRMVPEAQTSSGCSVAGAYIADRTPPTLAIAESASRGRRAFTALHELGHHLQQTRLPLMQPLLDHADGGALEEDACNSFAGRVLLPEDLVGRHFGQRGPTATDVVALWRSSSASRAAACVSAVEHLPAPGHVLLLDADGLVSFAAAHAMPPVTRGSFQGDIPVLREAIGRSPISGRGRTRVRYRDGILGDELYVQVRDMDGYAVAVLVIDHAPWEAFAPPSVDVGPQGADWVCTRCEADYQSFTTPCSRCEAPPCPDCNRCACAAGAGGRLCPECFLERPAVAFVMDDDLCEDCR